MGPSQGLCRQKELSDEERRALRVGDIVDAKDDQDKWYEAVIRYVDVDDNGMERIFVHYIGWNIKWDEKLYALDRDHVQRRGTHTTSPHRPKKRRRGYGSYNPYEAYQSRREYDYAMYLDRAA